MENKNCIVCGRPLRSKISKALGYGPVCKKKMSPAALKAQGFKFLEAPSGTFVGQSSLFDDKYIGGVDPVSESAEMPVIRVEEYAGKHVVLRHVMSDGQAEKRGRLEMEREMLLMYKGKKTGGDYFFSLDLKYHSDRILSIEPIAP